MNGDFELADAILSAKDKELRKKRSKRLKLAIIIVAVIIAASIIAVLKFTNKPPSPLPRSATKDNNFKIYYPTHLPEGYTYKANSYKISEQVAIFALQKNGRKVFIAEQALPQPRP